MNYGLTLSSLQDKKYRITKIRKEIIKIFSNYSIPLPVKKIENILSKKGVTFNKSTIYRELKFLLKTGYLIEVCLYPNEVFYESSELRHHHHLVCESCGRIENITNCSIDKLKEDIYKKKGFKIKRHTLEFYGICSKCAQKNKSLKR